MRWAHRTTIAISLHALAALVFAAALPAQTPEHYWSESYGLNGAVQELWDLATDNDGNVFATGYFPVFIDFGGGQLTATGLEDTFLAKFGPGGSHQWSQSFGGPNSTTNGRYVTVDGDGNVILVGRFSGDVDFGGGLLSTGGYDMFIAKFDPQGTHLWSKRFGGATFYYDAAHGVAVDADDNIVLVGIFEDTIDFGDSTYTSAGNYDACVAKFDAAGTLLWSRAFGGTGSDAINGVAIGASGDIALVGDFEGSVDFGGGVLMSAGVSDVFAALYDATGAHVWSQRFGDVNIQTAGATTFDAADDLLLTGEFYGSVDFGGGALTSGGGRDIFLVKLDVTGVHQWSQRFGGTSSQYVNDVAVDDNDRIAMVGPFYQSIDFGGGTFNSAGQSDVYLAYFDAAGTHLWSQGFGGTDYDFCYGVDVDPFNVISFGGSFRGAIDLGGGTLGPVAGSSIFLARYFSTGPPVIRAVRDVPDDQGGRVNLSWDASGLDIDTPIEAAIEYYSIWRSTTPAVAAAAAARLRATDGPLPKFRKQVIGTTTYTWEQVDSVDASFLSGYSAPVATLADASLMGPEWHYFQVIAHTGDPGYYFVSDPDSGFSIDNITPAIPQAVVATQLDASTVQLAWQPSDEPDVAHYAVYRGIAPGFVPGADNIVASPQENAAIDTDWRSSAGFYYKISAVDVHGNESGFALLEPGDVVHTADPSVRARTFLAQNVPNPFNPTTRITFGLDAPQDVTLAVYDASGARVRTLVSGKRAAARRYEVSWDGRDDRGRPVASGVYFFRLSGENVLLTRKAVLLK